MKHEDILKSVFVVGAATETNAATLFDATNMFRPKPILIKNSLNEDYFDLLTSSAALYQALYASLVLLESISARIEPFPSPGNQGLMDAIAFQTRVCIQQMRVATHGADTVMKEHDADIKLMLRNR